MPFVKGQPRPPNAGRKKGTPNRRTLERMARRDAAKLLEAKALEKDLPLDYTLRVMRDPATEPHRRDAMAKAAPSFVHPTGSATVALPRLPGWDIPSKTCASISAKLH
jgi:hypothetical protein